ENSERSCRRPTSAQATPETRAASMGSRSGWLQALQVRDMGVGPRALGVGTGLSRDGHRWEGPVRRFRTLGRVLVGRWIFGLLGIIIQQKCLFVQLWLEGNLKAGWEGTEGTEGKGALPADYE